MIIDKNVFGKLIALMCCFFFSVNLLAQPQISGIYTVTRNVDIRKVWGLGSRFQQHGIQVSDMVTPLEWAVEVRVETIDGKLPVLSTESAFGGDCDLSKELYACETRINSSTLIANSTSSVKSNYPIDFYFNINTLNDRYNCGYAYKNEYKYWSNTMWKAQLKYANRRTYRPPVEFLEYQPMYSDEFVEYSFPVKVTIIIHGNDVKLWNIKRIKIPGMDELRGEDFIKGVEVKVTNSAGVVKNYTFTNEDDGLFVGGTGKEVEFTQYSRKNGEDITVKTVEGDKVEYTVIGSETEKAPQIKGVPKIFPVTFAAQRQFLCVPDYGPNQYHPWIAFEAQTHFRKINSYPKSPAFTEKSGDWQNLAEGKSWTWYAQRQTDPGLTQYKPDVYYPKSRDNQRESQALGWAAQFLHFYKLYSEGKDNEVPNFLTGFDIDDWLIPAPGNALTAYNYTEYGGTTKNQNWQHMWDEEILGKLVNAGRIVDGDIVCNSKVGIANYPLVWDGKTGFPKAGFLTNDMVTYYQKYKATSDDDPATDLPDDYYFNAYEIEDKGTHYINATTTPSVQPYGTVLTRNQTTNTPAPCGIDCWYNDKYSTGNTKHPGIVTLVLDPGSLNPFTVSFRQEVKSAIQDPVKNPDAGFFGSLEGDQWPMGYGNKSTYKLKGVKTIADAQRISICMLDYQDGAMIPSKVLQFNSSNTNPEKGLVYNTNDKTLTATFQVYSSWMAIAAYYKSMDGLDSVIIAGRVPMVMDPLSSITIPGSSPLPYDNKSLALDNSVNTDNSWSGWFASFIYTPNSEISDMTDLQEGQGDRSWELMNEFRKSPDAGRGYVMPNGDGFSKKYPREYVLQKGVQATFSCIGPGRKIQSFWSLEGQPKKEDPYQSYRELARRMPQDIVAERLKWSVYKLDPATGERIPVVQGSISRHFKYTFSEVGEYEVEQLFNNDKDNPTAVHITVSDFDDLAVSNNYANLNKSVNRSDIKISLLKEDERAWLKQYSASLTDGELDNYRVAEVEGLSSYYAYALAPRANTYQHREGAYNDMSYRFDWYTSNKQFSVPDDFKPDMAVTYPGSDLSQLVNPGPVSGFLANFQPKDCWPEAWKDIWVNHIPGKATEEELLPGEYSRYFDGDITPANLAKVNSLIGNAHDDLNESQSVAGWLRWYPWIANTPSEGYKFNRYVKTTLKLKDFFSNGGSGIFSGKAAIDVGNVSNATASMDWYDYGSPQAQRPSAAELDRHMSDDLKNMMEFYHDLKAGRKIIIPINYLNDKKLILTNFNPDVAEVNSGRPDHNIFISSKVINEAPIANVVTPVKDIPLLTFDGARADMKNDLNYPYAIAVHSLESSEKPTYKIVHNGYDRFLAVDLPQKYGGDPQTLEMTFVLPPNLSKEVDLYGIALSVFSTGPYSSECKVRAKYATGPGQVPIEMGPVQLVPIGSGELVFRLPAKADMRNITLTFDRDSYQYVGHNVIHIDKIRLLKNATASQVPKPDFITGAGLTNSLNWLSNSVYRFYDWNYSETSSTEGVFFETAGEDKVSLSGLGMGIAATILSKQSGRISDYTARDRIFRVLSWIDGLNTSGANTSALKDGTRGWHGMPSHYYSKSKELFGEVKLDPATGLPFSRMDISTIDWAICAQGIRLARQYYISDPSIGALCTKLLRRVDWSQFIIPTKEPVTNKTYYQDLRGRIVRVGDHGYSTQAVVDRAIADGLLTVLRNGGRVALNVEKETGKVPVTGNGWGQTFTEEAELVYLEVLATNKEKEAVGLPYTPVSIDKVIYTDTRPYQDASGNPQRMNEPHKILYRQKKFDFIPNYKGSGFTYNWLQLWTGNNKITADNPANTTTDTRKAFYHNNSVKAYGYDNANANAVFGKNYMGLTAASTVSDIKPNGFIEYGDYLGNQGSDKNLSPAGEVVQLAPAPYGAVLALPFFSNDMVTKSLQAYADLGFYHEFMGFPDNIVIKNIGDKKILPNWQQLDINMAPIAMAIDQAGPKTISQNFLKDQYARAAYIILYGSFEADYNKTNTTEPITIIDPGTTNGEIVIKEVEDTTRPRFAALVYPNPTTGDFVVRMNIKKPGSYQLSVSDINGRIVHTEKLVAGTAGQQTFPVRGLKDKGLNNGMYFIRIIGQDGKLQIPVIIQK
ncbi:MAG: T9SS type A sorting domain-containing protein [Bacteroidota bacterium]